MWANNAARRFGMCQCGSGSEILVLQQSDAKLKIGDLSRETGLSVRMLRHYEDLGILNPTRSARGTRVYSSADVAVARVTYLCRELDVPLDVISDIATERARHATGGESSASVGRLLQGFADDLALKAEKSLSLLRIIADAQKTVGKCRDCQNPPAPATCPDCPMNAAVDKNPFAALIWRDDQE